jgi:hypothetical protein
VKGALARHHRRRANRANAVLRAKRFELGGGFISRHFRFSEMSIEDGRIPFVNEPVTSSAAGRISLGTGTLRVEGWLLEIVEPAIGEGTTPR